VTLRTGFGYDVGKSLSRTSPYHDPGEKTNDLEIDSSRDAVGPFHRSRRDGAIDNHCHVVHGRVLAHLDFVVREDRRQTVLLGGGGQTPGPGRAGRKNPAISPAPPWALSSFALGKIQDLDISLATGQPG